MQAYNILVYGSVQGVTFRHFCRINATQLGLSGWARNNPGGTLSIFVQGSKAKLDMFFELVQKGPRFADISGVEKRITDVDEDLDTFEIRY